MLKYRFFIGHLKIMVQIWRVFLLQSTPLGHDATLQPHDDAIRQYHKFNILQIIYLNTNFAVNKKDEKNINILRLSSEIEDLLRINNICTLYELINKNKSYLKKIGCTASN